MDIRNIRNGWKIPTENYCDQPYLVVTRDNAWLVVLTTGVGDEGNAGQHVVTMRSVDCGKTWSAPVDVESAANPESSYAVLLQSPSGRIFCFYNYNADNMRTVKGNFPKGYWTRVDSLGEYVFRYSDDDGKSWSRERIRIPVRETEIDRENPYGGKVRFFWNVGKPLLVHGEAYLTLHKIGRFGIGAFERSEGAILHSRDLISVDDPARAHWETLPDGDIGLRSPEGEVGEEQNLVRLSDDSLLCVWRTVYGSPAYAYSRDFGHTWTKPEYMTYADGRRIKHPRAANFVWKLKDGHYLYWFHNHGGKDYQGRNPAWLSVGEEYDAPDGRRIRWRDPEILLYDPDWNTRISYPDMLETEDALFITQTQKTIARTSRIDHAWLDAVLNEKSPSDGMPIKDAFLPSEKGFSFSLHVRRNAGMLLDIACAEDARISLEAEQDMLRLCMDDGERVSLAFMPLPDGTHFVSIIVDLLAGIVCFSIDGVLWDGGRRQKGWFRPVAHVYPGRFTISTDGYYFNRPLMVYEARALYTDIVTANH